MSSTEKSRRTRNNAVNIVTMPQRYAFPSLKGYQYAISSYQNPIASLRGCQKQISDLLMEENLNTSLNSFSQYLSNTFPNNVDINLMRAYFSIALSESERTGAFPLGMDIYVPDLCRYMSISCKHKDMGKIIMSKIKASYSVVGVIDGDILPVLVFMGFSPYQNRITIASPYLQRVMQTVKDNSIIRDRNRKPKIKQDGSIARKPAYSYLICPGILSERNERAVEIVHIIVALIEQAGNGTPNISARKIVEEVPSLQHALCQTADPSNQNKLLSRAFRRAWELLREKTYLQGTYRNLWLPDPDAKEDIPTVKTLNQIVYRFSHEGKRKEVLGVSLK